ncbi:MAG: glutathione S-transferase, partial [Burkholderiaceae bacterium]
MTSPKLPILYSFRRCPYAMRARLALLSSGIVCELREVVLRDKPPELLAASPKGTVPVLITADGQVIAQSLEIMLWALRQHDPAHWLPAETDAATFDAGMALLSRCDGEFKHHLDRYKYPQRYASEAGTVKSASQAAAGQFVADLETRLVQNSYLFNSNAGLFDAGILPFIRQFAHTDAVWFAAQPWPQVQAWLSAFEASAAFKQV